MLVRAAAVLAVVLAVASGGGDGIAAAQEAEPGPAARAEAAVRDLIARLRGNRLPAGIVKSNGRIEATQVDVAAKYPGRLARVTVDEGDEVTAGQVVATITAPEYEAQLRGAQAQVLRAKQALAEAVALIAQRKSDVEFTRTDLERGRSLLAKGNIAQQAVDQRQNKADAAEAALRAATAQRDQAEFAIQVAEADVQRLQAILVDLVLVSPRSGRVQYRLARAGEVVAAGQRVLTILDLKDVYLTVYLPAEDAGKLALGDEARIVADPIPEYVIPATVSFVATEAQFTPKSVETAEERQKLMFRVKLQVDPDVLQKYHRQVKTGVRGIGFVRTSPKIPWPGDLAVKLPK
ncbi:HlyD family efflux transporter periplasmic adaptor subunit [Rhodoplanes sp. TEM]|uniref:HlyD family efflux transporter periplasmic adaptor subunit n=1 Tax=Rhodoplanes tepidamans TaxID=200616 RepID=A0ABT5JH61_RHOTP|nr:MULTISPECIES: HlyD family efflux transporter periplasmic adaptor subunit [Rhodoplanes]MDC7789058.1 HlyD family efflux transporter periplasmic adaptor subunit [Rhodoplanes tepidamans]MDC7982487.1 HlyD family efflux transporter periplasmic adaptor subunit [Rhodoplanes sp. TEM]MDQ0354941.1 HlyD family secretion protein [Rhodoplanes tepidamans]